ncbi:glutamine--fructose-6-phosphate transaminase (isomerizing) [Vulgatibacter sp.]|uniref:glutamine--fructose-6-phosphate transaminase (isomerizing) n=1 Tax=Vulgatibacter sp. TaxID=1971226 RepID=UPI0035636FB6
MCGIVGYVGDRQAAPFLVEGLRRLEYRGYDSAGCAFETNGQIGIQKGLGKLSKMADQLIRAGGAARKGIGHTRWATHGKPSDVNAHPHADCSGKVVVVHNGIIENYRALREMMQAKGCTFRSETDTEVIAHLIEHELHKNGGELEKAVKEALRRLEGSFAIAAMAAHDSERMVAARRGSPLIVGIGEGERLVASDIPALLPFTRDQIIVGEGEVAVVTKNTVEITELLNGRRVMRRPEVIPFSPEQAEKSGYEHFMLKEIHEQPHAIADTIRGRLGATSAVQQELGIDAQAARELRRIDMVACGTSWHAALIGRRLLEEFAGIPATAEIASEYRYRPRPTEEGTLALAISQSGETADTLAAMRASKEAGARSAAICNVVGSSIAREADGVLYTRAGPEISVASTKAFTTQVTGLFLLALTLGRLRGRLDPSRAGAISEALQKAPEKIAGIVHRLKEPVQELATRYAEARDFLYLGRGYGYPLALEGALKLKEISYVHAEGYPSGEMKHGPIALISKGVPVVAIATRDRLRDKVLSNLEEVKAREGTVIAIGTEGDDELQALADHTLMLPPSEEAIAPLYASVPLQLFAYYVAVARGCDVDQPRNLAKSVTVE